MHTELRCWRIIHLVNLCQMRRTLELTEIFLFIGFLGANSNVVKVGGYIGIVTAVCAWYASAAGVANGMGGRARVPVGKPILGPR